MGYSSIKKKPCKNAECDKMPKLGFNGFCSVKCMPEEVQNDIRWKKGAVANRKGASLSKNEKVVHEYQNEVLGQEGAKNRQELEQWFDNIARLIARNPRCMECNAYIPSSYYRHATAHIFPKSIFESVATHPMNFLTLGAGCGCHDKTHRLDTFSDMKVFPEAIRRFKLFEKSITEKHKYLTTFLDYVNGTI